jgi:hypothetical protein
MIKLTQLFNEIKVNQPTLNITSNSQLYKILDSNIKKFAEEELNDDSTLLGHTFNLYFDNYDWDNDPDNLGGEDYPHNAEFKDMPQHIQQGLINYLVEVGLEFYGEWNSEQDNDDAYGISWNLPDLGLVYNWTDEADPGSYNWDETKFKGYKFYTQHFNI